MILTRIDISSPFYYEAYNLYQDAFPLIERRDLKEHLRVLSQNNYHFSVMLENDKFIGIMLYFESESFIYLEHFAVLPSLRKQGYGSKALELLKQNGKTVILEIEFPCDEITNKRLAFYEKNGFNLTEHYHIQPKYRVDDVDLPLKILSYPTKISDIEYLTFKEFLDNNVSVFRKWNK